MQQILIIIAIIAAFIFGRWLLKQPWKKRLRLILYILAVFFIILFVTGRLHWLIAAIGTLLGTLGALHLSAQKLFFLARWFPFLRYILNRTKTSNTSNQQSSQQQHYRANTNTSAMARKEALEILGLKSNATPQEIIAAHRHLIQKIHPDRGGSSTLAAKINKAKDVLLK